MRLNLDLEWEFSRFESFDVGFFFQIVFLELHFGVLFSGMLKMMVMNLECS